ncbi:MAG TPA: peptidase [Verrucomicrobiales bacterium]|nr:peptidase [Verrucomicrobiales bacterium]
MRLLTFLFITAIGPAIGNINADTLKPTESEALKYPPSLLPGNYNPAITTPSSVLGFPVGSRTSTTDQIVEIITKIASESERVSLTEYARSHEGRPLHYLVISSPENLARIPEVKADLARLADPRGLSEAEGNTIIDRLPAVAWFGHSIHGNEASGSDSALISIYHLAASLDEDVVSMLEKEIVIIDPCMNPDGRTRFMKIMEEARGVAPNVDDQSRLHTQSWPKGRYNHYLFDLNRDYIHGAHPETRGKVAAMNEWYPQLVIDAHEQGAQSNYHFSPSRQPINFNGPPQHEKWNEVFAKDQASAFDQRGWPYFNGQNYDDLYPGYTNYSKYRGAVNILYEQPGIDEDGVRRPDGSILTYKESVHHHLTSTLANLYTLAEHSAELYRDFLADRRLVTSESGPYGNRTFVVLPTRNESRMLSFVRTMKMQGFEMFTAEGDIEVASVTTQLGKNLSNMTIPRGSIVLPNRQPEARLLSAMLEFDTPFTDGMMLEERESLLRGEGSMMYEDTAWNTTMLHGLEAWTVNAHIDQNLVHYQEAVVDSGLKDVDGSIGYIINGDDDRSVGFAARAMESGISVRVLQRATRLDGNDWPRGSIVVSRNDHRTYDGDLAADIGRLADELGLSIQGFAHGTAPGDLPDVGGRYFTRLVPPSIAFVSNGKVNPLDLGAMWHVMDTHLGIRHSQLVWKGLAKFDLRRYNVIVLPDSWEPEISDAALTRLSTWVKNGGTLIANGGSAAALSAVGRKFTSARHISDTFENPGKYDLALQREWLALQKTIPDDSQIWSNVVPQDVTYPWNSESKSPGKDALKKLDDWQKIFMPKGAVLAARTDQKHWLTMGIGKQLPVLYRRPTVLMSDGSADVPVRFGVLSRIGQERWDQMQEENEGKKSARKIGWSTLPDQYEMNLRMSGLVWPEAAQRLVNTAYVTRERKGNGQIILFAYSPVFRGSTPGTGRLLLNALIYGPGLGTSQAIIL